LRPGNIIATDAKGDGQNNDQNHDGDNGEKAA